jgi:FMN-dependent oxidoreductase (nitrilotriacetate monooxygenase family)
MTKRQLSLNAFLHDTGHHEAAWRHPDSSAERVNDVAWYTRQAQLAEEGKLDAIFFADGPGLFSKTPHRAVGQLEPITLLAAIAAQTSRIGLIATASTTYHEPYNLARLFGTLDHISGGRAGWNIVTTFSEAAARNFGHDRVEPHDVRYARAQEFIDVVTRLWDSWEDDAIIKDVATGRFIDRDKLHYIDFEGRSFSVKGPSIVPRPPQGQPLVAVLAHQPVPWEFAATSGDVVFITPSDESDVATWVGNVRDAEARMHRDGTPLKVLADLVVFLAPTTTAADDRKAHLDDLAGRALRSDAAIFVGTPDALAAELVAWRAHGLDGFRLRPGVTTVDLPAIVDGLVPELQRRGVFRTSYEPGTLRERFGLGRPANRYARSDA